MCRCRSTEAFPLFTDGINTWWPFAGHSIGGEQTGDGGFDLEAKRLYEREADGSEHDWADIVAWEPPNRFLLGWRVNPDAPVTEVEVGSWPTAPRRGSSSSTAAGSAAPRADDRSSYDGGWGKVLGAYEAKAKS